MSSEVYMVRNNKEERIAICEYGDDAELIFDSYQRAGYACKVYFIDRLGDKRVTLECEERK